MMTFCMRAAFLIVVSFGYASGVLAQPKDIEVLDATSWDLSARISLKGKWTVIEEKLVPPDSVSSFYAKSAVSFPLLWNELRLNGSGSGCATYALNVLLPSTEESLALEIPQLYSSYKLWVNGEELGAAGNVAATTNASVPKWVYQTFSFTPKDTVRIVLQIANFHHHKGGAAQPIYLGSQRTVHTHFAWSMGSTVLQIVFLLLEGLFFVFYYRRSRKRIILYFALLCLTWSVRSLFSNLYPITFFLPDFDWTWLVRIEYITLYLAVIWAALFLHELFDDMTNVIMTYLPVLINVCFLLFTLATSPLMFTRWISLYLGIAALVILHGVILTVRALLIERRGSGLLMSSICIGILLFGYDIAAYHTAIPYNIVFMNLGYIVIFLLTTIALLYHLRVLKGSQEKEIWTLKDMFPGGK
jgi:hypothetical protein